MNEYQNIHLLDVPVDSKQGSVWNRLHEEREEITEALVKSTVRPAAQRKDVLEARLNSIDEALDRVMAGSYGICARCSHLIEESTLDVDAAWTVCLDCWSRKAYGPTNANGVTPAINFEALDAFDTIILRTLNSEYRIFLLDPKAGRALVEGGTHLAQPVESFIMGSVLPGTTDFKSGVICLGGRLKLWVDERMLSTSVVQSFEVKHNASAESLHNSSTVFH